METKKSNKSNLENRRFMFFQLGAIIALTLTLVALKWKTADNLDFPEGTNISEYTGEIELIPITRPPVEQPPALPFVKTTLVIQDDFSNIIETDWKFDVDVDIDDIMSTMAIFNMDDEETDDTPFIIVEDMPEFMGGDLNAFRKYVMSRLDYPQLAKDMGIQGTVYICFVINSQGVLSDLRVTRGVDPLLDNEVLSVVKNTPKWEPGKQRGNPVNVMFNMPVNFRLN